MTDSAVEAARKTVEHYKRTGFAYDAGALKFAIALLSSQSQVERMREALELIEVDLEAGDVPAKTRVAHALSRTKAWIAALTKEEK
jgi:hypothetical protein